MRSIRMLGLAVAIIIAAAVTASSALATSTALCKVHEDPCASANQVKSIHLVNVGNVVVKFKLFGTFTFECKKSLNKSSIGSLGSPQPATIEVATVEECSVGETLCKVETVEPGSFKILKTALNLGTIETAGTTIHAECGELANCEYVANGKLFALEGAGHTAGAGNGMVTAKELEAAKAKGGLICPSEVKLTVLYEFLEKTYVTS